MFYKIIALLITITIQLLINSVCTCDQLLSYDDCFFAKKCVYDDMEKVCKITPCSSNTVDEEIAQLLNCAKLKNGSYTEFSDCSDYSALTTEECQQYYPTCELGTVGGDNGTFVCKAFEIQVNQVICSYLTNSTECIDKTQADGQICDWDDTKGCYPYDPSQCSTLQTQQQCDSYDCVWIKSKCREPYCSEQTLESDCTYFRGDTLGTYQICQWNSTTLSCSEAQDGVTTLDFLNASNCLKNSFFSASWNSTNCVLCQDGFSTLISLGVLLSTLF